MSKKGEQEAKEANFAGLCKELYPKLEVADSVFVEALRKHGDEGLAMEEVANWQPWESKANMDPEPAPKPKPSEPDMDSIERQKREFEKFEKANKERLEREKKEKDNKDKFAFLAAQAKREEKAQIEEEAKKAQKARQEEKARLAKEEAIRLAREEQAKLARSEREKAKAEEEMKARIRRQIEQEEKEKRQKEENEKRQREEKDRKEREKKDKAKRQNAEKAKRQKEEKQRREKEEKERREIEEKERKVKEEKERKEREEKELREKEEKERREQEEERIKKEVRERFEKEKREQAEKERIEKEEKERIEKEEKERIEKEEKERIEKEAKEKAEKEAKEKAEKEAKEKAEDKGKEKSDDQDIGDIIKELQDLKEMKVDFVGANAPPRVSIYVGQESDLSAADHQKIKDAFMKKGISEQEIRILGVAADREIQQFLKTSLKKDSLAFPIVCVDGQPVGSPSDVYGLDDTQIEKLLSSTPEDPLFCTGAEASDSSEVTLGAMNQVLTAGEYLASGVGSLLMLPVTALTWPFRSAPVDPNAIKGKNDVEFDVIHTNWYWRSQWRVFRFSDTFVARLHPRHRDMRAAHQYDTICKLQLTDTKNIVFHYSDNSSPDYLHAKEEDVREMVKIVQTKNPDVKITKGEESN